MHKLAVKTAPTGALVTSVGVVSTAKRYHATGARLATVIQCGGVTAMAGLKNNVAPRARSARLAWSWATSASMGCC